MVRVHSELGENGVGQVIRIVGSATGTLQLKRTAESSGAYKPLEVKSMEEALALVGKTK